MNFSRKKPESGFIYLENLSYDEYLAFYYMLENYVNGRDPYTRTAKSIEIAKNILVCLGDK